MIELLKDIISEEQISSIKNAPKKDRLHPVRYLMEYTKDNGFTYFNTEDSLKRIKLDKLDWLKAKSDNLAELDDFSTPSSFLGEVRALGYLLGSGFNVEPIDENNKPTPDFNIINNDGEEIEVEVNSKQLTSEESSALEEFNKKSQNINPQGGITSKEHVVTPFGEPRKDESVTENVICKISSIKQSEKQFSNNKSSILWLDFQDEIWRMGPKANSTFPLRSWREDFYSGEIWYAFYGKKGLPIFEGDSLEPRAKKSSVVMRHEGRYKNETKIDACIVSFNKDTVILENPSAKNPLPEWFFNKMPCLRWFNVSHSWLRWPENKLFDRVQTEILRIEKLDSKDMYSW